MLQPTALINEAYIRLIDQSQPMEWQSRAHFFGIAARIMRLVLVDCERARRAEKRGGGDKAVTFDEMRMLGPERGPCLRALAGQVLLVVTSSETVDLSRPALAIFGLTGIRLR